MILINVLGRNINLRQNALTRILGIRILKFIVLFQDPLLIFFDKEGASPRSSSKKKFVDPSPELKTCSSWSPKTPDSDHTASNVNYQAGVTYLVIFKSSGPKIWIKGQHCPTADSEK